MGIAPEIAQDGGRPAEGRLGVDDPVGGEQGVDEGTPLCGVAEVLGGAGEIPAARAASRTASQITFDVIGLSARQPSFVPGKRYVCGRIQR
jgi:hypothetical protein